MKTLTSNSNPWADLPDRINKAIEILNDTIEQLNLIDIILNIMS